jgi:hypothetical protein
MSKKLIAVASAAALALSALVAMPSVASPGPFTVTASGSEATNQVTRDGSTAAKALRVSVPTRDVLRYIGEDINNDATASTNGTAIKIDIQTPGATDAITVTATGGVEVLTDTAFDATAPAPTTATGTQSLTDVAANGDATIYAYTTSTASGTVVISAAGSSRTIFIQGRSVAPYKIAFTGPTSVALGGKITLTGTVKDAFGNDLTTALTQSQFDFTAVGATVPVSGVDGFDVNATTNVYTVVFTAPTTAQGVAVQLAVKPADRSASITAFGTPVNAAFFSVTAQDLSAQVTALQAQVAALTAQLAATVTKAKYNKLVRKWNRANPNNKVKRVS